MRRSARSIAAFLIGLALVAPGPAAAQSCFSMQAEMMRLQAMTGGSGGQDTARFERAYREQMDVISRTQMRAQSAGCFGSGFFLFRRAPDPSCNMLIPKLRDMQENLARLDHLRRQGGSDDSYRLRELQGMMSARGCDLPGGSDYQTQPDDNWYYEQNRGLSGNGTYRTLCVRTCDGYYFPISFSTTSERLNDDAQTCEQMCPGAEAQLYYYENPGGGPENMVSITGEPYSALPTAFQYRTKITPSCTCKPAGGTASTAPLSLPPAGGGVDLTAPLPQPRPAPGEDPETMADRAGFFVPRAGSPAPAAGVPVATSADGRSIRVVGPPLGNTAQDALVIAPVPN